MEVFSDFDELICNFTGLLVGVGVALGFSVFLEEFDDAVDLEASASGNGVDLDVNGGGRELGGTSVVLGVD